MKSKVTDWRAVSLSFFDTLSYCALFVVVWLVACLPFRALYVLSDIIYIPFYYVVRYRRKIVRRNLTGSFPDKNEAEIVGIEKRFYRFFVDMSLESCKLMTISKDEMRGRMKFTGTDVARKFIEEGKSVSVYLGHYGNWEWESSTGLWFREGTVMEVYRKLRNRVVNRLMSRLRRRMGNIYVNMHDTARFMASAARDGRYYACGLLADQSPKRKDAKVFIPFLNRSVPVITGTERVTKRYGHAAMFIRVRRVRRGYYEGDFIPLHEDPASLPDYELTRLYFQQLEAEIQRQPELYLWTHRRFKYARPL
ncbi:MAG: lysophospholipid acyltransferase family protein [Prevotella sp.]|nr:lysophospholipid acyltransferase family protein [Prevotella sp.]